MSKEDWSFSDGEDFSFSSKYGNDLLNHIARAYADGGLYSVEEINEAVDSSFTGTGGDVGTLWERLSGPAIDALARTVEDYWYEKSRVE